MTQGFWPSQGGGAIPTLTFLSKSGFPDRARTLTLTHSISRIRIFLAKRRWLTSYLTRITHLRKFEWILPEGNWVKASKLQKQVVNRNQDPGCPATWFRVLVWWSWHFLSQVGRETVTSIDARLEVPRVQMGGRRWLSCLPLPNAQQYNKWLRSKNN